MPFSLPRSRRESHKNVATRTPSPGGIPQAFLKIASEVKHGNFRLRIVEFGMNDRMVRVVFNPQLKSRIPARAMAQVMRAQEEIQSGAIRVEAATGG